MRRGHFSEIIKNTELDIKAEYNRLFDMFYLEKPFTDGVFDEYSLCDYIDKTFLSFPFRGTCVSLEDFDRTHSFIFEQQPRDFDIDYLINFCEYSYNLTMYLQVGQPYDFIYLLDNRDFINKYLQQVNEVINKLRYRIINEGGLNKFVPNSIFVEEAVNVSDKSIEERLYEYNHFSYKGDLAKKKDTLLAIYDKMTANESELKSINKELSNNLAFAFNNLNLRHNNVDNTSKDFQEATSEMSEEEMEKWYDDIYQLCLLAIIEVGNIQRKKELKDLQQKYRG